MERKSLWLTAIIIVAVLCANITGYFMGKQSATPPSEAAKEQPAPTADERTYSWFVSATERVGQAALEIQVWENQLSVVSGRYKEYGGDQSKWPEDVRKKYDDEFGIPGYFMNTRFKEANELIGSYNKASAEFNWAPFSSRKNKPPERLEELKVAMR